MRFPSFKIVCIALSIYFTSSVACAFSETVKKENFEASFDCTKASSQTEKTICTVRELAEADIEMASIYKSLLSGMSYDEQLSLKNEQLAWLKAREQCVNENEMVGCLKGAYKGRTEVLKKRQTTSKSLENSNTVVDCSTIYAQPDLTFSFLDNGHKVRLIVMQRAVHKERLMTLYIEENDKCRSLISDPGGYAAYYYPEKNKYPGIAIYGKKDNLGHFVQYYRWTGRTYEQIDLAQSSRMNAAAQELLDKGQSEKAIVLWEQAAELTRIPGLNLSANPEVLYNLGYAYYKKGKDYFVKAATYLIAGIKIDSASDGERRYTANRKLGDIYSDLNRFEDAIQRYKWGAAFSLSPAARSKIIDKIKHLRQLEEQNGTLPQGTIVEPVEDFIADVRILRADDDYGHIVRVIADFNNDGLKDMAINMWPFGTAVPQWHLYLKDKNGKYLRAEDIEFHPATISIQPIEKNSARIIATVYGSSQDERNIVEHLIFGRDMVGSGIAHDISEYDELFASSLQNPLSEYCIVRDYFKHNCDWTKGY